MIIDEMIKLVDSRHDEKLNDYKSLIEEKVAKIRKKSQDNNIIEKE